LDAVSEWALKLLAEVIRAWQPRWRVNEIWSKELQAKGCGRGGKVEVGKIGSWGGWVDAMDHRDKVESWIGSQHQSGTMFRRKTQKSVARVSQNMDQGATHREPHENAAQKRN
jgi:hypothetical protein